MEDFNLSTEEVEEIANAGDFGISCDELDNLIECMHGF